MIKPIFTIFEDPEMVVGELYRFRNIGNHDIRLLVSFNSPEHYCNSPGIDLFMDPNVILYLGAHVYSDRWGDHVVYEFLHKNLLYYASRSWFSTVEKIT